MVDKQWFSNPPRLVSLPVGFHGKEGKSVRVPVWEPMCIYVCTRVSVWERVRQCVSMCVRMSVWETY